MSTFNLPIDKIQKLISIDSYLVLLILTLVALVIYKILLKKISTTRHSNLLGRFKGIYSLIFMSACLSIIHWVVVQSPWAGYYLLRIANFIGLISFLIAVFILIKLSQIFIYLYLFWANMSQGVPRLIANIFTLIFSTALIAWIAAEIFNFNIATVLATSAIFTIVLGLALQDTLGNLFSGVALQMERPFYLGNWIEVNFEGQIWVGQVHEITWRATSLTGFGEELIIIPNKIIAQSQLMVFNEKYRPARFILDYKFAVDSNLDLIKEIIFSVLEEVPEILREPAPRVLLSSITEQWLHIKVFYTIKDYGQKNIMNDHINSFVLEAMRNQNIKFATPILTIIQKD